MSFKGGITRLSELIADLIQGAHIIGGIIEGASITATAAVLDNPAITGGTTTDTTHTNPTITGGSTDATTHTDPTVEGGTITGTQMQTAASGQRIVMRPLDPTVSVLEFFAGISPGESPAQIVSFVDSFDIPGLELKAGTDGLGHFGATVQISGDPDGVVTVFGFLSVTGGAQIDGNLLTSAITATSVTTNNTGDVHSGRDVTAARNLVGAGLQLDGRTLTAFDFGSTSTAGIVTDASGNASIPHGLGVKPTVVVFTPINPGLTTPVYLPYRRTGGDTTTAFGLVYRDSETNATAPAGVSVVGHWIAFV